MKKGLIVLFITLSAVLFTGCSKKEVKLVCTQTTSGVDVGFYVGFKGNTVTTMDLTYDMDLSKYSDTQITAIGKQDFCSRVKSAMSQFKDAFRDCSQDISNKKLNVKANLDVDKVAKSFLDKKSKPEDAKKALEGVGYKCTIQK